MNEAISIACLTIVLAACSAGVFSSAFRDNWPQFVGLTGATIWAVSELVNVVRFGYADPREMILYAALASFSFGTSLKVWRHHVHAVEAQMRGAPELPSESWDAVSGGNTQPGDRL